MSEYEYKSGKDLIAVDNNPENDDIVVTVAESEDPPFQRQVARILISHKEIPNLIAALQKVVGPPKSFGELYSAATAISPTATVEEDSSGQIVIHTNLRETSALVPFESE